MFHPVRRRVGHAVDEMVSTDDTVDPPPHPDTKKPHRIGDHCHGRVQAIWARAAED
jgi:hypothetical protein